MKKLLIVVDMQNDFIDGVLGTKEAVAIVNNVCTKIKKADASTTVVCTKDTHFTDYLSTEEGIHLPVEHCIVDTKGWELNSAVKEALPKDSCICFNKTTFGSVDLCSFIRDMDKETKIDEIEVIGVCTDICVISNAVIAKAAAPNAHIVVDAACCAGVTPESHDNSIKSMKTLQIEIKNENQEPWRE